MIFFYSSQPSASTRRHPTNNSYSQSCQKSRSTFRILILGKIEDKERKEGKGSERTFQRTRLLLSKNVPTIRRCLSKFSGFWLWLQWEEDAFLSLKRTFFEAILFLFSSCSVLYHSILLHILSFPALVFFYKVLVT